MTSSGIRGIRRKKSALTEVKIAVLGASGVGKTALIVRFLTKRFIGEYERQIEQRYRNEVMVDNDPVLFEILDHSSKSGDAILQQDMLNWADGFMLVYSITDRKSFNWVKQARLHVIDRKCSTQGFRDRYSSYSGSSSPNLSPSPTPSVGDVSPSISPPLILVGNKADMVHVRQVSTEEGEILAKDLECPFLEVAASEHVQPVTSAFQHLLHEVQASRKRSKTSLLDRVLGSKATRIYVRGKSDSSIPRD